ncbi:hypothetical protein OOT33_13830 [Sphingobium sp. DEHP117]|uniref:hypothetical protein n=1 Tax=Sphingobium sp. DEHP117 TaxID=2993436 RepID=UPI0027D59D24|nr:hypothetical protein [Sphingobium sp. DEHP117]MDQ4421503.1 hypothetical protein [Sphingobium sp. DEHP117]
MCIICDVGNELGGEFLGAELRAQQAMREAEAAMLKITKMSPALKKKYDHFHKALVRARKEYNRVQYLREIHQLEGERIAPKGWSHGDTVQIPVIRGGAT